MGASEDSSGVLGAAMNVGSKRYVAIWQVEKPLEITWMTDLMSAHISEHVYDGKHELVLPNAILFDKHIAREGADYYRRFQGTNSILVHYLDETYDGGYERYCAFAGVIRIFWAGFFKDPSILTVPIGYRDGPPAGKPLNVRPSGARRYVWSFSGEVFKSSRPDMITALADMKPHFLIRSDLKDGRPIDRNVGQEEYYEVMTDSMFAPCPMGNANIESYRFYEALECGAIPIVEKRLFFDYYRNLLGDTPVPTVSGWKGARRLVRDCLGNAHQLEGLQRECFDWWQAYKPKLRERVSEFLADSGHRPPPKDVTPRLGVRPSQYLELVKHHDMRALARRIEKQVSRLVRGGGWRKRM
jgi:hypothetical protein